MKVPEIKESVTKELVKVSHNEMQFRIVEFVQKKAKKDEISCCHLCKVC